MSKPTRVTLYTSRNCPSRQRVKAMLQQHQIPFRAGQIDRQRRSQIDLQRLGARIVPVVLFGERRIDGYHPEKLCQTLLAAETQLS